MLFVPAAGVKDAAISAIDAGIKLTVLVPDRVPVWDAMEIAAAAKANGANFLGPNTLGVLSPGKAVVGMIGGRAESARQWFKPGIPKGVGVISRSGRHGFEHRLLLRDKPASAFRLLPTSAATRFLEFAFPMRR